MSKILKDNDPEIGAAIACALAGTKDLRAVKPLINALDNPEINRKCAYNLTRINEVSTNPLIDALNHEKPIVRQEAAWALGEIGTREVLNPLLNSLNDKDCKVKYNTIEAIGKIGNMNQYNQIYPFLEDNNKEVRKKAEEVLIAFETEKNIPKYKQDFEIQLKNYLQKNLKFFINIAKINLP